MLVAKKELKSDEIEKGMTVWVYQDAADYLTIQARHATDDETIVMPTGPYKVLKTEYIRDSFFSFFYSQKQEPVISVTIKPIPKGREIILNYNEDSLVLLADRNVLMDKMLYRYFDSKKELIEENMKRWKCIACDLPLNIISPNLRICKSCEEEIEERE